MKTLKFLLLSVLSCSLFSCVEDEVVFREKEDVISFERSLFSVAKDETPLINVKITTFEGTDNLAAYNVSYMSSDEDVFTFNEQGNLIPNDLAVGRSANVIVVATLKDQESENQIELTPLEEDSIEVGLVTISEREAITKDPEDLERIVANGYEPRGVIGNQISEIDIDLTDMILSATFFNFKNENLIDPDLSWVSSNPEVLQVNQDGGLTPIAIGSTSITVSAIIDGETITAPLLVITVGSETVVVDQPEEEEQEEVLGFGTLMSNSFYDVEGTFRIVKEGGETRLILNEQFSTASLPDLVIYLSNSTNTNTGALIISDEILGSGAQTFTISDNINVDDYSNVLLFCRRFNQRVGFGVINR